MAVQAQQIESPSQLLHACHVSLPVIFRAQTYYTLRSLAQVLTKELGTLVGSLQFLKSMRWNSSTSFSRPVRWLLAFHGKTHLPFTFAGLQAQPASRGLRQLADLEVSSADDYRQAAQADVGILLASS